MPLPPKPPELEPMPFEPEGLEDDTDDAALPRVPAEVEPALRLAVRDEELLGTELTLLPTDALLTDPAAAAALVVAAPTLAVALAADLLLAATPPPVPAAWPDTAEREACSAVLREAAWADVTLDGVEPVVTGGAE